MKLKLSQLNPNPFKKMINGGKLNEEQIQKILSNLDELKLMGSIPVVQREGKYFLVSHHHRIKAMKRKFGENYEVEITVHDYDDDHLFRGMIIENLSQRGSEFSETSENIDAIEKYLNDNPKILSCLRESRKHTEKMNKEFKEKATSRDIAKWLDDNKGKVMSHDEITNYVNINNNLDPELKATVEKKHNKGDEERRDGTLNMSQAVILSKITDKKEQKDLAKALTSSEEIRVREQGKLITIYKESPEELKQKVRDGDLDLKDIPIEKLKIDIRKKIEEDKENNKGKIIVTHYKQYQNEAGNKIGRTNKEIIETCLYLNGLDKTGVLLQLDWRTMLKILESGTEHSKNYNKYMEKILTRIK